MAEENKLLTLVYTFFLGLLLAIFVGIGVNTFYPAPTEPEYPTTISQKYDEALSEEQLAQQQQYDEDLQSFYEEEMQPYNRNVSIITLIAAVIFLAASFFLEKRRVGVIADGVMLGGLFTLLYSLIRGFTSEDTKYSFIVITIGLALVFYLGYHRYVKPQRQTPAKQLKKSKSAK